MPTFTSMKYLSFTLSQSVSFSLSYYPGKTYVGKISYIYPTVDPQARTVKVRVKLPNPGFVLKPQMFANAQLRVDYGTKIIVPEEAVLNSGTEQHVFVVHDGGVFEPRKVVIGPVVDGHCRNSLGTESRGNDCRLRNFLIDSESGLKKRDEWNVALRRMAMKLSTYCTYRHSADRRRRRRLCMV